MSIFLGIDPGNSGAIACLNNDGTILDWCPLEPKKRTERDISDWLSSVTSGDFAKAMIEKVSAMPGQGVASTFKFGKSYGFLIGLLTAHGIPYETVTPAKWQQAMQCRTGGDKNITKAAAQRLWPHYKFTHANADAMLLAEYARRQANPSISINKETA